MLRLRHVLLAVAAVVAALVTTAAPAQAHATLVSTAPGQGAVVRHVGAVSATFDESVGVSADSLEVYDPRGRRVDSGDTRHGASDHQVEVRLEAPLEAGTYTVSWHVISADTHPVSGSFTFSLGHRSAAVAAPSRAAGPSLTATFAGVRWLGYSGFCVAGGGLIFLLLCWPAGGRLRRTRALLGATWLLSWLATWATLFVQGAYDDGTWSHLLRPETVVQTLDARAGIAVMVRLLLLTVLGACLALAIRLASDFLPRFRRQYAAGCLVVIAATAATWSVSGHDAVGTWWPIALLSDCLHLTAVTVWLGGVAMLVAVALPGTPVAVSLRFSRIALPSIAVIAASGSYQAWRDVGSWGALVDSVYGRLVLAKIAGLLVVVLLAYAARRVLARPTGTLEALGRLRRLVAVEVVTALAVLAVTAVLVQTAPGTNVAQGGPVAATRSFDTGTASGTVRVEVSPARTGRQTIEVDLLGKDARPYRPAQVTAQWSLPGSSDGHGIAPQDLRLRRVSPGSYRATRVQTPLAGTWRLAVTVRSDAFDETTVAFPVPVAGQSASSARALATSSDIVSTSAVTESNRTIPRRWATKEISTARP